MLAKYLKNMPRELKNLAHKQTAGKRTTLSEQFASPYCAPASSMSSDLCVIPVKLLILTQAASRAYSQKLAAATTWRKAQVAKRQMAQMPPKAQTARMPKIRKGTDGTSTRSRRRQRGQRSWQRWCGRFTAGERVVQARIANMAQAAQSGAKAGAQVWPEWRRWRWRAQMAQMLR